jgi:hypothetical protein
LILLECVFAESIEFARVGVSPPFFNTIGRTRALGSRPEADFADFSSARPKFTATLATP